MEIERYKIIPATTLNMKKPNENKIGRENFFGSTQFSAEICRFFFCWQIQKLAKTEEGPKE